MSDDRAGPTAQDRETERIRSVYAARARRPAAGRAIGEAYRRINDERRARTRGLIARLLPAKVRPGLVDVGCGGGLDLEWWRDQGWPVDRLAGADLVADRVASARERVPGVDIRLTDGPHLPWPDGSFDVATAVTVFSSIADQRTRKDLFEEMRRVVRPGGIVLVYDFVIRNPRNPDVVPIRMADLRALGGPPLLSVRLSPFLYAVAAGAAIHPWLAAIAMRIAPPTHRLTCWRLVSPQR